jgi:ribosomal subunit interface protein
MQVSVRGKQLDVGEAFQSHAADQLDAIVGKYFSKPIEAQVVLTRDAHLYRADIQVHVGRGLLLQSNGEATQPYPAFETAAERLAKRLRRYKRRLRDHHREAPEAGETEAARQYILEPEAEAEPADGAEAQRGDEAAQPVVIAEMAAVIDSLTVGEAVMRMDLADQPALLFRNRAHGGLNMVYRRQDGNVGWVDPASAAGAHSPSEA